MFDEATVRAVVRFAARLSHKAEALLVEVAGRILTIVDGGSSNGKDSV